MNNPEVIADVEKLIKIWLGTEYVYSEYKPKKEACEVTAYMKVWGRSFRLDWEYRIPPNPKEMPDAKLTAVKITEQLGKDLAELWTAGPDHEDMMRVIYGEGWPSNEG